MDGGYGAAMQIAPVSPETTRIGWIGLGVMGASMASNLLRAGYQVRAYTRTPASAEAVLGAGATWADSPAAAAEDADVIISIVGYPADVREVILGETGALSTAKPGAVIVDMTTSEPSLAVEIADACAAREVGAVDAPVSGGDVGAREGRLSIMAGGDPDVVAALGPVWDVLGTTTVHQGGPGAGQHTKAVNQTLVAGCMIGVCEALLYAYRSGLDPATVLESVASGAAGSWNLSNLGPRIIAGNFGPGFFIEHFVKDMGIALAEADRMGLDLPGLTLVKSLYDAMVSQGQGRLGTQALITALAQASGVDLPEPN